MWHDIELVVALAVGGALLVISLRLLGRQRRHLLLQRALAGARAALRWVADRPDPHADADDDVVAGGAATMNNDVVRVVGKMVIALPGFLFFEGPWAATAAAVPPADLLGAMLDKLQASGRPVPDPQTLAGRLGFMYGGGAVNKVTFTPASDSMSPSPTSSAEGTAWVAAADGTTTVPWQTPGGPASAVAPPTPSVARSAPAAARVRTKTPDRPRARPQNRVTFSAVNDDGHGFFGILTGSGRIGREPGPGIALAVNNRFLSQPHADVVLSADDAGSLHFYIQDLDSTNGTTVNGLGLEPGVGTILRDGDVVGFAGVDLLVDIEGNDR